MHCDNCGKEAKSISKFCAYCGAKLEIKGSSQEIKTTTVEREKDKIDGKKESVWMQFLGIIIVIASIALGRFLGLAFFVLLIPAVIGWYLASWYVKKVTTENGLTKFIAWINIVSWFIPIAGLLTSLASIKFSESYGKKDKKYLVLGIIGLCLAVVNGVIGAWQGMQK